MVSQGSCLSSEAADSRIICAAQRHGDRKARLTPRNLSTIVWALGSFGYAPSRMHFLLDLAEERLEQCNAQDLSNILCGLAACERADLAKPSLLASAELHACSMMTAFSPQVPLSPYSCKSSTNHPKIMETISHQTWLM